MKMPSGTTSLMGFYIFSACIFKFNLLCTKIKATFHIYDMLCFRFNQTFFKVMYETQICYIKVFNHLLFQIMFIYLLWNNINHTLYYDLSIVYLSFQVMLIGRFWIKNNICQLWVGLYKAFVDLVLCLNILVVSIVFLAHKGQLDQLIIWILRLKYCLNYVITWNK